MQIPSSEDFLESQGPRYCLLPLNLRVMRLRLLDHNLCQTARDNSKEDVQFL